MFFFPNDDYDYYRFKLFTFFWLKNGSPSFDHYPTFPRFGHQIYCAANLKIQAILSVLPIGCRFAVKIALWNFQDMKGFGTQFNLFKTDF